MHVVLKKILYSIFPFFKLKNKHLSWYKKLSIYFEIFIMLWFLSWLLVLYFYHFNFQEIYKYKNINLYSKNVINCFQINKLNKSMLNIDRSLKKHKITLKTLKSDIYLVNSYSEYFMIMPPLSIINYRNTMAFATLDKIYFKYVNIYDNKSYFNANKEHSESFELVLSHELIHVWQEENYGLLKFILLSDWVKEGYAMYVTEENVVVDVHFFLNDDFKYFDSRKWYKLWGLMVKHSIEKMHYSVDDLHLGKVDYDEVLNSLLNEYDIIKFISH